MWAHMIVRNGETMALTDRQRTMVATIMPITMIWNDFLEKHEYIDNKHPMSFNIDTLMKLVNDTNTYAYSIYTQTGVTQEEWDEITKEVMPLVAPKKEGGKDEGDDSTGSA